MDRRAAGRDRIDRPVALDGQTGRGACSSTPRPTCGPADTFSRVALVRSERQIYISGLFAREAGNGEAQAGDVFAQLKDNPRPDGQRHEPSGQGLVLRVRRRRELGVRHCAPEVSRPARPPAASLVMVHGVGKSGRTLTMDMIAVGSGK